MSKTYERWNLTSTILSLLFLRRKYFYQPLPGRLQINSQLPGTTPHRSLQQNLITIFFSSLQAVPALSQTSAYLAVSRYPQRTKPLAHAPPPHPPPTGLFLPPRSLGVGTDPSLRAEAPFQVSASTSKQARATDALPVPST